MKSRKITAIARDREGATAIDYALIAALIVVGLVAVFSQIGGQVVNSFNLTANQFSSSQ